MKGGPVSLQAMGKAVVRGGPFSLQAMSKAVVNGVLSALPCP